MAVKSTKTSCAKCFQYEQILKATPSLLYVVDKKEQLIFANFEVLNMLGAKDINECNKQSFYELMAQKSPWMDARIHALRDSDLEIMQKKISQYNFPEPSFTDKRGVVFYYAATRVPLKNLNDEQLGLIVYLNDITRATTLKHEVDKTTTDVDKNPEIVSPYPKSVYRDKSKPPKFLVIEDNLIAQQVTHDLLTQLACEVDLAATNNEVESVFLPGKYDVVLMDIGLEGTSGYLMAKRLRQIEKDTGYRVPIIALTGFDANIVKTDCDYYFMEGAITKPLLKDQARQIIQRYIYDIPVAIKGLRSLKHKGS